MKTFVTSARCTTALALLLSACASSGVQGSGKNPPHPAPEQPAPLAAAHAKRVSRVTLESVGLDASALDRKADPCRDFYQFACGGWLARTEIPADKPRWVRSFNEIHERNEADLRNVLEKAQKSPPEEPLLGKLGSFYAACMDESGIEKAGLARVAPLLAEARSATSTKSLTDLITRFHRQGIWVLFDISAEQDFKDATRYVAYLDQGGLGLPDRDYYLKEDPKSEELRQKYRQHVTKMMELGGLTPAAAAQAAEHVMHLETELAKISKTKVERRDPKGLYNKIDRAGLEKLVSNVSWQRYFDGLGHGNIVDINVTSVKFFEGLNSLLREVKPAEWRDYLQWQILHSTAQALPKAFVDEAFAMEQALTGQKEQRARWKRCVQATDQSLGELLAQPFVEQRFAGGSKPAAQAMISQIGEAFGSELLRLDWMDPETLRHAQEKLKRMAFLIGYPDKWKTYDFAVSRKDYLHDLLAARDFELQRQLKKIGGPVDRSEWDMTPPTVNAYYTPLKNQMVFPAGILQPPFYDVRSSVTVNLGAMGMVVGHELTHGFDDEGSQFDDQGNLSDWWSSAVKGRFLSKTNCVDTQYAAYEALPGVHLNGKLTLGENIADMGGVKLAFQAYRSLRELAPETTVADGFDEDQQFFLAAGQIWCSKYRDEYARMAAQVDPHSPPRFRVNGSLSNLPAFAKAFSCAPGAPMAPKNTCSVW